MKAAIRRWTGGQFAVVTVMFAVVARAVWDPYELPLFSLIVLALWCPIAWIWFGRNRPD